MTHGIAPIKSSRPKWMDGAAPVPQEAGNVFFPNPQPPEPMNSADRIAASVLLLSALATVVCGIAFIYQIFN